MMAIPLPHRWTIIQLFKYIKDRSMFPVINSATLFSDKLNNVSEFISQLKNVSELTGFSFMSH